MRNLVVYRQSLTIATGKWNVPCRKENEGWVFIGRASLAALYDRFPPYIKGSFPLAIVKMKKEVEKNPIWDCKMTSKQTGGYRIYHLICKRVKK